jgi:hypothetical protein
MLVTIVVADVVVGVHAVAAHIVAPCVLVVVVHVKVGANPNQVHVVLGVVLARGDIAARNVRLGVVPTIGTRVILCVVLKPAHIGERDTRVQVVFPHRLRHQRPPPKRRRGRGGGGGGGINAVTATQRRTRTTLRPVSPPIKVGARSTKAAVTGGARISAQRAIARHHCRRCLDRCHSGQHHQKPMRPPG